MARGAVRLVGPVVLVAVLLRLSDERGALLAALTHVAWLPALAVLLLNVPNLHLKIWRWRLLLKRAGYDYPASRAWTVVLSSTYLALVTPGRIGDVARVQYLKKDLGASYGEGLGICLIDRACDVYVLLAFVVFGAGRLAGVLDERLVRLAWLAVGVAVVLPVPFLVRPRLADLLVSRIPRRWVGEGIKEGLEQLVAALKAQWGRQLVAAILLTALVYLGNGVQAWLIASALGVPLGFPDALALISVEGALSLLPVSVSGVGTRELFMALAFPALGLPRSDGVAFGLVVFGLIYLAYVAAGFASWQLAPPPVADDLR